MGDEYPTVRAAAVQAASVFLDREASIEKACRLIREAGDNGAQLIAFPEGFVPAHPIWFHFHAGSGRVARDLSVELFKNAVEIPGPHLEPLQQAADHANATVVVGICEKLPDTFGTLYNSQLFIGPNGQLLGRHRKIMPTVGERLVHAGGQGDGLLAFDTEFGRASALICGENSNPLAIFTMTAQYPLVHVQSWPNHFPTAGDPLRERVMVDSRAFAQMSKAWVVAACGTVDDRTVEMLELTDEQQAAFRDPDFCGGSVIVDPMSHVVAGPLGAAEGILYADMDLELGVRQKLRHDFAGHYNRPDIFELHIHTGAEGIIAQSPARPLRDRVDLTAGRPPQLDQTVRIELTGEQAGTDG